MIDRINPFCKMISILSTALLLAAVPGYLINILVSLVAGLLLATSRRAKPLTVLNLLLPAFLIALSFFFTGMHFYNGETLTARTSLSIYQAASLPPSFSNGLMLSTRIMAYAMLGILFGITTDSQDLIASAIQQGHMKPEMAYGILAAVHLLPTIKEEFRRSKLAYGVRKASGIQLFFGPVFCMLVRTIRWSEFLAMAMEARGFSNDRTAYRKMKVTPKDLAFAFFFPVLVLAALLPGLFTSSFS